MRKFAGILLALTGALLIFVEILWTTEDTLELAFLPPFAAKALVFLLGLTGMLLVYAGFRVTRGR